MSLQKIFWATIRNVKFVNFQKSWLALLLFTQIITDTTWIFTVIFFLLLNNLNANITKLLKYHFQNSDLSYGLPKDHLWSYILKTVCDPIYKRQSVILYIKDSLWSYIFKTVCDGHNDCEDGWDESPHLCIGKFISSFAPHNLVTHHKKVLEASHKFLDLNFKMMNNSALI